MVQANKKSVEMKVHAIDEALALVKEGAKAKFESITTKSPSYIS